MLLQRFSIKLRSVTNSCRCAFVPGTNEVTNVHRFRCVSPDEIASLYKHGSFTYDPVQKQDIEISKALGEIINNKEVHSLFRNNKEVHCMLRKMACVHKGACQYAELVMNLLGAEGSRKLISDWAFQNLETREC